MPVIRRIKGATRVLGKSQGYLGLPIRDEKGSHGPQMVSAWELSSKEIEALMDGASLVITILGTSHPPIMVGVEQQ